MATKQQIFDKIAELLNDINDQYQSLEGDGASEDSLKAELFEATVNYFAAHVVLYNKLSKKSTVGPSAAVPSQPTEKADVVVDEAADESAVAESEDDQEEEIIFTPAIDLEAEQTLHAKQLEEVSSTSGQEEIDQQGEPVEGDDEDLEEQVDDVEEEEELTYPTDGADEDDVADDADEDDATDGADEDDADEDDNTDDADDSDEEYDEEALDEADEEDVAMEEEADDLDEESDEEVLDDVDEDDAVDDADDSDEEPDEEVLDDDTEDNASDSAREEAPADEAEEPDDDTPAENQDTAAPAATETVNEVVNEVTIAEKEVIVEEPHVPSAPPVEPEKPARPLSINEIMSAQRKSGTNPLFAARRGDGERVTDIKSAISLNDKLLFIKDLFNGYSLAYSEAIELLNRYDDFDSAEAFLLANYAEKNNWADKQTTVDKLYAVMRKRFG